MTPKEADDEVVLALRLAEHATEAYSNALTARDDALAHLRKTRDELENVLREAAGLAARPDRREEYLRLHTFKEMR